MAFGIWYWPIVFHVKKPNQSLEQLHCKVPKEDGVGLCVVDPDWFGRINLLLWLVFSLDFQGNPLLSICMCCFNDPAYYVLLIITLSPST